MISRLPPTLVSFVAVVCGYAIYVLVAVPWIEPRADLALRTSPAGPPIEARLAPYREQLSRYFPAGHWALNNPKVLESPQTMLLLQDWRAHDKGRVDLVPCAILFFPTARGEDGESARAPIILEAPQGAQLQFDSNFDLAHGKIGNLLHGELAGPITIRSDMDAPGPRDDLSITTRDVQLNKSRIWTDADVEFRLGAHHGHGRQMEIRLLPAPLGPSSRTAGINVGGIHWLELKQQVLVELYPEDRGATALVRRPQQPAPQAKANTAAGFDTKTSGEPPIRVTCKGPFHFDLLRRTATFEDQVDVHRLRINAASDTLSCRLLTLEFAGGPRPDGADSDSQHSATPTSDDTQNLSEDLLGDLRPTDSAGSEPRAERGSPTPDNANRPAFQLRKIIAEGSPVKVNSPATGGLVRCPKLEYMPSAQPGELPEFTATGPGHLVGAVDNDLTRTFRVAWSKRMALRNHHGQGVISIWGQATVAMAGAGTLSGDQMRIYLKEVPKSAARPDQPNVFPDRMEVMSQAEGARNVRIASQPLTGAVEKLEVWFVRGVSAERVAAGSAGPALTPATTAAGPSKPKRQELPHAATYDIRGRLLQVEMIIADRVDVANLTVSGAVRFHETRTENPDDIPLQVAGSWLRVEKADTPATEVTVRGQPASIAARGLTMEGNEIRLHRGDNRLSIESPGQLSLPVTRGMASPLGEERQDLSPPTRQAASQARSGPLRVSWQGQMDFDGQRARFNRSVIAWDETGWLKTQSLTVTLSQKIRFDQSSDTTDIDVAQMVCQGGVKLQNQTLTDAELTALDEMTVQDLSIDRVTGDIHASGPGWVSSVRMGSANPIAATVAAGPQTTAATDPRQLHYLQINFERAAKGNLQQQNLTFFGGIRAVHGPVDRWDARIDPDSVDGPGPDDVRLTSHSLTVTQTGLGKGPRGTVEIDARGNAMAEGRSFTARAERMSYVQSKEQLILEGTGRTDARLWRQTQLGAAPEQFAARKFTYWLHTGHARVDDYKTLNVSQTPQPAANRQPAAARLRAVPR